MTSDIVFIIQVLSLVRSMALGFLPVDEVQAFALS
jgi:hypothetical protein